MAAQLVPGSLELLKNSGSVTGAVVLQVIDLQETNGKLKCSFSDGKDNMAGVITSQVARQMGNSLKSNDIVKVTEGNVNNINEKQVLIVAAMELIESSAAASTDAPPAAAAAPKTEDVTMQDAGPVALAPLQLNTDAKTPAPAVKTSVAAAPPAAPKSGPTPPSTGRGGKARPTQPISSLNPYIHGWAIRAKVVSKGPKRSFSRSGAPSSVFSAEIVDEQGTVIEGTFWRDAADRYFDLLEDGKVYVFARGTVKPANKTYARCRNDYALHFDAAAEVEPYEGDIDMSAMAVKMQFVAIDQLAAFVDKKAPLDLIGVVTSLGALGSVKRKSDATELSRRELTIVDTTLKTVNITLWGALAETAALAVEAEIAAGNSPVVAISACRVSSYNGVSVSTLSRSQILVNPDSLPETKQLAAWWATSGRTAEISPVGEGMANAAKTGGASQQRKDLVEFRSQAPATADAKPVYATVAAAVASINPDQTMWYLACPENNRKVVEQDGGYFCEYDGRSYPTAVRRYIFQARFTDSAGELPVQIFDDQAKVLLGRSADDAAVMRDADPARYAALLADSTWSEWVLRLKAQAQEYNGETRQRFAVVEIKPMEYARETRRMLDLINGNAGEAA